MIIGEFIQEHGGIYAGIVRGEVGQLDYHLFHAGAEHEIVKCDWQTACEKAKLKINGFSDWSLPNRREARLLAINSPDRFDKSAWYWTSTHDAGTSDYVWIQDFSDGDQCYGLRSYEYRALAVRRVYIEEKEC